MTQLYYCFLINDQYKIKLHCEEFLVDNLVVKLKLFIITAFDQNNSFRKFWNLYIS
jgi:hypothetical protein